MSGDRTEYDHFWSKEQDMKGLKKYWYFLAIPVVAAALGYIGQALGFWTFPV